MRITNFTLVILLLFFFNSCSKDSEPKVEPDTIVPVVELSIVGFDNLSNDPVIVSNQIEINVDAQDAGGISKIEAFINEEKVGEDTTAPYNIIINISSYESRINDTNDYTNYVLKVTATDNSGNSTSKEQIINIDNEIPVISEVSLESDTIINGTTNDVTFLVTDNQELQSIEAYLNNVIIATIDDENYNINLDTSLLTDGNSVLKIIATDAAGNSGEYTVSFIVDNTGPEISLESLTNDLIIDEPINIEPLVTDTYSVVSSVEILLDEVSLELFVDTSEYEYNFDPFNYSTGDKNVVIKATDDLGNESITEFPIEILRRLITINFPAGYFNPSLARSYVFASSAIDGKALDTKEIQVDTETIILRTLDEVDDNYEFMLTFANYETGTYGNNSDFTTLQNLQPGLSETINLKLYPRFSNFGGEYYDQVGFNTNDIISITPEGAGYGGSNNPDTNSLYLERRQNTVNSLNHNSVYIPFENLTMNEYSYLITDWDIPSDFVLSPDLFTTDGIERKFISWNFSSGEAIESSSIWVAGYLSNEEFENNLYHRIFGKGYSNNFSENVPYFFNSVFDKYRYQIRLNNYFTERTGEPLSSITAPDWTIDYNLINKEINLTKSGTGHSIGKAFLGTTEGPQVIDGLNVSYYWHFVFDSETTDKVIIPEIPEDLQSWGIFQIYEQDNFEMRQVELKRYQTISSYEDYIEKIIKTNKLPYLVAPIIESKFKSDLNNYHYKAPNFLLD